jgi:gliding motility-associated protein GldL
MNFGEIVKTKRWKVFMGYVYGWGASIVMIGALFKLEHFAYSGYILGAGLITEAVIFFLSAFEPPLEMPDWSKVYPELRDEYETLDFNELRRERPGRLDNLINSADIPPELIDKVTKGLNDLSNTARNISDISTATLATDQYVRNLGSATDSMGKLAQVNTHAHDSITRSVEGLVSSYNKTAEQLSSSGAHFISRLNQTSDELNHTIAQSGKLLANTYHEASKSLTSNLHDIDRNSRLYTTNLETLNKNIEALNNSYVSHLKYTEDQFKASKQFSSEIQTMNDILTSSIDELMKYKENAEQLNEHLEALNSIYGGMLGAMNYKK